MPETQNVVKPKERLVPFSGSVPYYQWEAVDKNSGKDKKWSSAAKFWREAVEEKLKKEKLI